MKEDTTDNLAFWFGMLLGLAICITGVVLGYRELELSQRDRLIRECDELDEASGNYVYRLGAHLPGGYYYKSKKSHD